MCQYIKDDGEQCSMTDEPFCHHHEDTGQAKLWEKIENRSDELMGQIRQLGEALQEAQSGSEFGHIGTVCSDCETELRRTERLTRHPNFEGRVLFEAVVECDCSEHVLGSQSVAEIDVPGGWTDD